MFPCVSCFILVILSCFVSYILTSFPPVRLPALPQWFYLSQSFPLLSVSLCCHLRPASPHVTPLCCFSVLDFLTFCITFKLFLSFLFAHRLLLNKTSAFCFITSWVGVKYTTLLWVESYLKNNNLAIIGLQVEGPGGGDEALGGADDVVAPTGHGLHHRGGLRAESHGSELWKREQDRLVWGKALNIYMVQYM